MQAGTPGIRDFTFATLMRGLAGPSRDCPRIAYSCSQRPLLLLALEAHNPGHKQPILVDRVIDLPDGLASGLPVFNSSQLINGYSPLESDMRERWVSHTTCWAASSRLGILPRLL